LNALSRTAYRSIEGTEIVRVPLIGVIDDDASIRDALSSLLHLAGYDCALFESAEAFLSSGHIDETDCLILDVRLPGAGGLEFQRWLAERRYPTPMIVVSSDGDAVRASALARGAVAVLGKPFSPEALLGAIHSALHPS